MFESPDNDLPETVPLLARAGRMHSPRTSNATLMRAEHRWQPASLPTDASRGACSRPTFFDRMNKIYKISNSGMPALPFCFILKILSKNLFSGQSPFHGESSMDQSQEWFNMDRQDLQDGFGPQYFILSILFIHV